MKSTSINISVGQDGLDCSAINAALDAILARVTVDKGSLTKIKLIQHDIKSHYTLAAEYAI